MDVVEEIVEVGPTEAVVIVVVIEVVIVVGFEVVIVVDFEVVGEAVEEGRAGVLQFRSSGRHSVPNSFWLLLTPCSLETPTSRSRVLILRC